MHQISALHRTILIFFVFCILFIGGAGATGPAVIITDHSVTPAVLMPGEQGLIRVTLMNTATTAQKTDATILTAVQTVTSSESADVPLIVESVFLDGRGDISVLDGNAAFTGVIGPGQSIDLTFLIKAPEKEGVFFPRLRVRVKGGESTIYPIPVNVNMPISHIRIPDIQISQRDLPFVQPGETINTELTVENIGKSPAHDILISLGDGEAMIAPVGARASSSPILPSGSDLMMPLSFRVSREIEPGLYSLPITIRYHRVDGTLVQETASYSVDVRGSAALAISSVRTEPVTLTAGEQFNLVIRLENTGTGRATSVYADIDIPMRGSREAFIGTIRPGNDAPAVFRLTAGESGDIPYTLTVRYSDDYGDHESREDLIQVVQSKGFVLPIAAAILILIIIGASGYYLLKKKRTE
ncbi:hypothetical protein J2T58_000176 [Methanocalculus alkaliphilus]|uniref:COG1361 S-layer family protein n=1 Tax=Methanocalculus alkaliphilus TaxID=768730 RepID=UPI00209D2AD6|nr:hypothetical protein [Methanocalculus alkaliphilus]MCP1714349.1 hypothetical protein [Methanocalculus alkaliphilus]